MQQGAVQGVGRRRLRLLLCSVSGGLCATAMALVLIVYGTPFNPMWWLVMGGILAAAFVVPMVVVPVVEWVIAGYLEDHDRRHLTQSAEGPRRGAAGDR